MGQGSFCLVGENWTGISLGIIFFYFLVDIVSLPQDIYYIWATTTTPDLANTLPQIIGFGLALANIWGLLSLHAGMLYYNLLLRYNDRDLTIRDLMVSLLSTTSTPSFLLFPHFLTMIGSINYALYIALNQALIWYYFQACFVIRVKILKIRNH